MPPKTTPKKPKTRSRVARGSPNVSPVFSVFPDQADLQRVIQGPAGNTRSRRTAAPALNPGLSRTQTGRVRNAGTRRLQSTTPAPPPEQSDNAPVPGTDTDQHVPGEVTQQSSSNPVAPQEIAPTAVAETSVDVVGFGGTTAPTTHSTAVGSGDKPTSQSVPPQQKGASSSSKGGKRSADGDDTSDLKRPRLEGADGADQDGSKEATTSAAPVLNPCEAAAAGLARFRAASSASSNQNVTNPVVHEEQLLDSTLFRAIAAVTEAISQLGRGVQFSVVDWATIQIARIGQTPTLPTTRPGNEVLIPWTPGDGHSSLYVVIRTGESNNFTVGHYDSTDRNFHRGVAAASRARRDIVGVLNQTGWNQSGRNMIDESPPSPQNATRQRSGWECGIHVIFSAWAYALRLQLVSTPQTDGMNYTTFLRQGRDVINLALQGQMDSDTVRAFLECYGFILPGQTVPFARSFDQTRRFATESNYLEHNATVRIENELDARRANGEDVPTLAAIRIGLTGFESFPRTLTGYDAQMLLDLLASFTASMTLGNAATQLERQSGVGSDAHVNNTQPSPVEPDPQVINEILLAEAAAIVAARSAAAATAQAVEREAEASAAASTEPSRAADESEADALQLDAGRAVGGSSQQQTDQQTIKSDTDTSPTHGDQEGVRSPTPGSLSSVESDDEFFGSSDAPPTAAVVQPVVENAGLANSREVEAGRVARARAGEERRQAARAVEEQAAWDATASNQEETEARHEEVAIDGVASEVELNLHGAEKTSTQEQEKVQESNAQLEERRNEEHQQEDFDHEEVQKDEAPPLEDDLPQENVQQDQPQQEGSQEEDLQDNINDLFDDDDSLFGNNEPVSSPPPPPTAHRSGLSLPPTPIRPEFAPSAAVVSPSSGERSYSTSRESPPGEGTALDITFADDEEDAAEQNEDMEGRKRKRRGRRRGDLSAVWATPPKLERR